MELNAVLVQVRSGEPTEQPQKKWIYSVVCPLLFSIFYSMTIFEWHRTLHLTPVFLNFHLFIQLILIEPPLVSLLEFLRSWAQNRSSEVDSTPLLLLRLTQPNYINNGKDHFTELKLRLFPSRNINTSRIGEIIKGRVGKEEQSRS